MNCRFSLKREPPYEIEANSETFFEFLVTPGRPGPFSFQAHMFVADPGVREIVFTVRGKAAGPATAETAPDAKE